MGKLTDIELRNWVRAGIPVSKTDGDSLIFTLSEKGTAAWTLRYRIAGRRKELTLGRYPDLSLAAARELAAEKRVAVSQGVDVAQAKQDAKRAAALAADRDKIGTVQTLYDDWYARQIEEQRKDPGHVAGVFALHILPSLGRKPVAEVRPADIDALLRPLSDRGKFATAKKVLQLTKALFNYGMKRHIIPANPAAPFGWVDIGGKTGPRSRVLSRDELARLFKAMRDTPNFPPYSRAALCLLLATGVRKMELLQATWDEFDVAGGVWHLPKERTKTEAAIRIPLSAWALEVLKEQQARRFNEYVFPLQRLSPGKVTKFMGETTLNHALYMLQSDLEPFCVHDLRRTARTHLAALGIAPHIAEMCLNHKPARGIEAVYNVHDYFEERRAALCSLGDLLAQCEAGQPDKVIPFKTGQRA